MEATQFRRGKSMACPHCGGLVTISFTVDMDSDLQALPERPAREPKPPKEAPVRDPSSWREFYGEHDLATIDAAEANGVLAAFDDAQARIKGAGQAAKDVRRMFLTFLSSAIRRRIDPGDFEFLISVFGREGTVDVWAALGIGAVLVDGEVRAFIPVRGKSTAGLVQKAVAGRNGARALEGWIRSRWGYVVGRGAHFDAMRQHRIGDFARLVQ